MRIIQSFTKYISMKHVYFSSLYFKRYIQKIMKSIVNRKKCNRTIENFNYMVKKRHLYKRAVGRCVDCCLET